MGENRLISMKPEIIQLNSRILRSNVANDILIKELQHQRNTIRKDQVLGHVLKLVDVVQLKVLQVEQQDRRDGFDNNLLVAINIDSEFCGLDNSHSEMGKQRKGGWGFVR